MSYAQLDEHFDEHPKYQNLELEHFGLMACGISYCNRLLTDGKIPMKAVRGFGASGRGVELAEELVKSGIWMTTVAGYEIVGFLDHNPSRAKVLGRREAERARKEAFRNGVKRASVQAEVRTDVRADGAAESLGRSTSLHFTSLQGKQEGGRANDSDPPESERRVATIPPRAAPSLPSDDGTLGASANYWNDGIRAFTRKPCVPLKPWERKELSDMGLTHGEGLRGQALCTWVRDIATEYARNANPAYGGYTVAGCVKWLNAGKPPKAGAVDDSKIQKSDLATAHWRKNVKVSDL